MQLNRSNVNFVPENVILDQQTKKQTSAGIKFAVILCIICCSIYAGIWFYNLLKQRQIDNIQAGIDQQQSIINSLQEFGKKGYKLGVRLEAAKDVLESRNLYSRLVNELNNKVIDSVALTEITFSTPTEVVVKGNALSNYAPVGEYTSLLLQNKQMFKDIKIVQAKGSGEEETVEFTLNIELNAGGLNESIR